MKRLFDSAEEVERLSAKNRQGWPTGARVEIKVGDRVVHEGPVSELETRPLKLDTLHQAQRPLVHRLVVPTETDECRTFVEWTKLVRYRGRPLFDRLAKIPNDRGKRSVFTAIMVAIGLRRGFPDYVLLAPMFAGETLVAGLFLEAKRIKGGKVDDDQLYWRSTLIEFGYHAEICAGAGELIDAVRSYMRLAPPGTWQDTTRGST